MHLEIRHDHDINIKEAFREYINDVLDEKFAQYFSGLNQEQVSSNVSFQKVKTKNHIECKVTIHGDFEIIARGDSEGENASSAFELALAKIIHKMHKYKDKFDEYAVKKYKKTHDGRVLKKLTFNATDFDSESEIDEDTSTVSNTRMRVMSSIEAVMELEITGLNAITYIDEETKHICFVYKRSDGEMSFIDTQTKG